MKPLILALTSLFIATLAQAEVMKMAVTTSFANSGLSDVLLPQVKADTGLDVQLLIVGTGQALKLGAEGDVDSVLVHAKAAEEAFVAAGHGTHRRKIMYNDFIIVGPSDDPAKLDNVTNVADALTLIAQAQVPFVSRGDDSGTHKKELSLWNMAGITPEGAWYKAVGQGMGAALNTAAGMNAYIMTDRATWLKFGNKANLVVVFEEDPPLFNQYAYLPVNPANHPHINAKAAQVFEEWLVSDTARDLINAYQINGERLFYFNADSAGAE